MAKGSSVRLLKLLNGNAFTVQTFGLDGAGQRTFATVMIARRDVREMLIDERLARGWPDGDEWGCQ